MKFTEFINNPILKKGLGVALAVGSGIAAVSGALADQKKEREFEDLKKAVSDLQKLNK